MSDHLQASDMMWVTLYNEMAWWNPTSSLDSQQTMLEKTCKIVRTKSILIFASKEHEMPFKGVIDQWPPTKLTVFTDPLSMTILKWATLKNTMDAACFSSYSTVLKNSFVGSLPYVTLTFLQPCTCLIGDSISVVMAFFFLKFDSFWNGFCLFKFRLLLVKVCSTKKLESQNFSGTFLIQPS